MKPKPRIVENPIRLLVGRSLWMSLKDNKTAEVWRSFMPRRNEIKNRVDDNLISMTVYNAPLEPGNLEQPFEKWAAVEVSQFENIPKEM